MSGTEASLILEEIQPVDSTSAQSSSLPFLTSWATDFRLAWPPPHNCINQLLAVNLLIYISWWFCFSGGTKWKQNPNNMKACRCSAITRNWYQTQFFFSNTNLNAAELCRYLKTNLSKILTLFLKNFWNCYIYIQILEGEKKHLLSVISLMFSISYEGTLWIIKMGKFQTISTNTIEWTSKILQCREIPILDK